MATDPLARLLADADRPIDPRPAFAAALLERVLAELDRFDFHNFLHFHRSEAAHQLR